MKCVWIFLIGALLSGVELFAEAANLTDMRVWHGKNGKHFRGKFMVRYGDKLQIQDTRGRVYKVSIDSLSETDKKWFQQAWARHEEKKNRIDALDKAGDVILIDDCKIPAVSPIGYKKVPVDSVNRSNIPIIDQGDYHDKDFNNHSSGMVHFFLWWHNEGIVKVPSRRDDNEKRIKWLYRTLNKNDIRHSSSGDHVRKHLMDFAQNELKTKACFHVIDLRDGRDVLKKLNVLDRFDPALLANYVKGANAAVLSVKVYKKGRYEWTADVPLVECDSSGKVVFYMYGNIKLTGKLVKLPFEGKRSKNARDRLPRYEIQVDSLGVEDWFKNREYTFFLEDANHVGLKVIVPYPSENADKEDAEN